MWKYPRNCNGPSRTQVHISKSSIFFRETTTVKIVEKFSKWIGVVHWIICMYVFTYETSVQVSWSRLQKYDKYQGKYVGLQLSHFCFWYDCTHQFRSVFGPPVVLPTWCIDAIYTVLWGSIHDSEEQYKQRLGRIQACIGSLQKCIGSIHKCTASIYDNFT